MRSRAHHLGGVHPCRSLVAACVVASVTFAASRASAGVTEPGPREDQAFDFMNLLAQKGMHDLEDESWNAYGQSTYIGSYKLPFSAKYTNLNGSNSSLLPSGEYSWTWTVTLWAGFKLWRGAEAYVVPEVVSEVPLSGLKGLGSTIQNFELQKQGSSTPTLYQSRAFLQQTFGLGGKPVVKESDPGVLGGTTDSRRVVLRAGNYSIIDFFDKNSLAGDLRRSFFNMAFVTYAAYDFVADARGYSWGGMAEVYYNDWSWRIGRSAPPLEPNTASLTFQLDKYYGDQAELEHDHKVFGQDGAVRILGFRNRENMGRFDDAVAAFKADPSKTAANCGSLYNYGSTNATAPDLCWVRKPNTKVGIGISIEQHITPDFGLFFRGMYSDGHTEVYAFTSTDRSASLGAVAKGTIWKRPLDVAGMGVGLGWISQEHATYLKMGGVDGFIGDGNINPATESVFEIFYSFNLFSTMWLSADYQHIGNPAFNANRGPVDIFGGRVHAEF